MIQAGRDRCRAVVWDQRLPERPGLLYIPFLDAWWGACSRDRSVAGSLLTVGLDLCGSLAEQEGLCHFTVLDFL